MITRGCDYAWERPDPGGLYAAGYRFACRYLSYDTSGKNLTSAEAALLRLAGIDVVSNWEWQTHDPLGGRDIGIRDAKEAKAQHTRCGGPDDRPIYFSVDFEPTAAQLPVVGDYFRGIATVLPLARIGAYGGLDTLTYLRAHNLATWWWQTYAWSGRIWLPNTHIQQVRNGVPFGADQIDEDQALTDDFGQWGHTAPGTPAPTWTENLIMNLPTVARGDHSRNTGRIQGLLRAFGYTLATDSDFGPITEGTVQAFQRNRGLLVDGVVGQHTWTALLTA